MTACVERTLDFTPVVYTCGVSVFRVFRRAKAVLGGLQSVESTQNHGSEKAGVGGSTPSLATKIIRISRLPFILDLLH